MGEDLCARLKFGVPVFGAVHREENDDNSRPTSFKSILFFFSRRFLAEHNKEVHTYVH